MIQTSYLWKDSRCYSLMLHKARGPDRFVIALSISVNLWRRPEVRAQELCESRGGRPGLPVTVDVKQH